MTDRRRQAAQAPLPASRALTVQGMGFNGGPGMDNANPNRRASAFLAHLAQQYDGITARRASRSQRIKVAMTSYGAEQRERCAPRIQPTRDLKT